MKNQNNKKLTTVAMIIALIALLGFVPMIGFINVGIVAITLVHIPVILGCVIVKDYKYAFIFGLTFGLVSWTVNLYTPSPSQAIFFNPLVSILPRMFVGLSALFFYNLSLKLLKNDKISMVISSVFGTATNTLLVLSAMGIFSKNNFASTILTALKYLITVNGGLEIVVAAIIVPILATAVKKSGKGL